jgi:hypothetical protein
VEIDASFPNEEVCSSGSIEESVTGKKRAIPRSSTDLLSLPLMTYCREDRPSRHNFNKQRIKRITNIKGLVRDRTKSLAVCDAVAWEPYNIIATTFYVIMTHG